MFGKIFFTFCLVEGGKFVKRLKGEKIISNRFSLTETELIVADV